MKRLLPILIVCLLFVGCKETTIKEEKPQENIKETEKTHYVIMDIKDYGEVKIELYEDIAPKTVANFLKLVKEGFYDGLTFHRIINGFMIQGGDPEGTGFGGSSEKIEGEFASNGHENNLKHDAGVLSMARAKDPNSASSQFFIVIGNASHLDGDYAAFGKVIEGMDYIYQIANDAKPIDNNGTILPDEQPIITSVKICE